MTTYTGNPWDILPEQAPEWADEDIVMFLEALEQQGRLQGRNRAIVLLTEQGRWPIQEKKPRSRAKKDDEGAE